jgi:hypothetical protein
VVRQRALLMKLAEWLIMKQSLIPVRIKTVKPVPEKHQRSDAFQPASWWDRFPRLFRVLYAQGNGSC